MPEMADSQVVKWPIRSDCQGTSGRKLVELQQLVQLGADSRKLGDVTPEELEENYRLESTLTEEDKSTTRGRW